MYNPLSVIAEYFPFDDFIFTYNLNAAIVAADVGKALTLDTAAANTMKLLPTAGVLQGRLLTFEDRTQQGGGKVGAVERKLRCKFTYNGTAPAIGDMVEGGAVAGTVAKIASQPAVKGNQVIAIDVPNLTVTVELF